MGGDELVNRGRVRGKEGSGNERRGSGDGVVKESRK
jgi:hypothetical protein